MSYHIKSLTSASHQLKMSFEIIELSGLFHRPVFKIFVLIFVLNTGRWNTFQRLYDSEYEIPFSQSYRSV